jgi:hypothetical protein
MPRYGSTGADGRQVCATMPSPALELGAVTYGQRLQSRVRWCSLSRPGRVQLELRWKGSA